MALPNITLDDRTFDQLFAFMRKQIDTAEWTDHNPSDPGIVLLELLCWIGEMILYRADRVPDAHLEKFANLIVEPPELVTVPVTFTATLDGTRKSLTVPVGTRLATVFEPDSKTGRARRFIFETIEPATFVAPQNPPPTWTQGVTITAREYLVVDNEELGVSDGTANQTFPLRPIRTDLGLPLDHPAPVLLDFVNSAKARGSIAFSNSKPAAASTITVNGVVWTFVTANPVGNEIEIGVTLSATLTNTAAALNASTNPLLTVATYGTSGGTTLTITYDIIGPAGNGFTLAASPDSNGTVSCATLTGGYDPNPQVTVGGKAWELKQFLLTEQSPFNPAKPDDTNHLMVEPASNRIRFGDNRFGTIPASGVDIVCTRYQLLQGPDALIPAKSLKHLLDLVCNLGATEKIEWENGAAEGGGFFFRPEERLLEGLKRFRRPHRLITGSDFEQVMRIDFNEFQELSKAPERVLRTIALMNRRPQAPQQLAPGNVTLVVLAVKPDVNLDDALTDPALAGAQKEKLVTLVPELVEKIKRFLDKRRLITTRIHLQAPTLTSFSINTQVAVARERNTDEMTALIKGQLRKFLGVIHGDFDGKGWPLGGSVYRSKLFRLIEEIDGVDHVEILTLAPADALGDIPVGPIALPALDGLSVSVVRV
jgi:hypothetical protein